MTEGLPDLPGAVRDMNEISLPVEYTGTVSVRRTAWEAALWVASKFEKNVRANLWYWVEVPGQGSFITVGEPNSSDVVAVLPDTGDGLSTAAKIAQRHNRCLVPPRYRSDTSGDIHLYGAAGMGELQ